MKHGPGDLNRYQYWYLVWYYQYQ